MQVIISHPFVKVVHQGHFLERTRWSAKGALVHYDEGLQLHPTITVTTLAPGDRVRYLGVDYESDIVIDEARLLRDLKTNLDLLTNSDLLHPDQKLNVVNNFIWPALIYPLQTAPLSKLKSGFLEDVDRLIRGALKQFCGLPMDTPNAMLYTSQKHRGLGAIRASWEAFLQHINIAGKLLKVHDPHLNCCRDLEAEIADCMAKLDLPDSSHLPPTSVQMPPSFVSAKSLRHDLRETEFHRWCALPHKGQGVEVFADVPACNKWVTVKSGLSTSEWTNALKMSTNGCNLRSNPRTAAGTTHCRHCSEYETLPHVLGKCPRGELLRNQRHHRVCDFLAEELRKDGHTVLREDHVADQDHGSRFCDLVVIDSRTRRGFVLDPTVRFERSNTQASEVDEEKRGLYQHTLPAYRERFPMARDWTVLGLLFGARGAIPRLTADVLTSTLGLRKHILRTIGLFILKDSISILNHHLYTRGAD